MKRVGSWAAVFDRMKAIKRLINAGISGKRGPILLSQLFYCIKHDAFGYIGESCSGHQLFDSYEETRCRKLSALEIMDKMGKREMAKLRKDAWRKHAEVCGGKRRTGCSEE